MPNTASTARRLIFIDALRAFAILMMLQGHFVHVSLADVYRDMTDPWYTTWAWWRGLTAPIFFTVTGLVFTYLLLGQKTDSVLQHPRWRKGIRRGFLLVGIGYLLRTNFSSLLGFHLSEWMFQTDVLHCIGIALLFLCLIYALARQSAVTFGSLLLVIGLSVFLLDPVIKHLDTSHLWTPISHYVNRQNGAIFSPLPWIGYSCFGALIGLTLRNIKRENITSVLAPVLIVSGLIIANYSAIFLMDLHYKMGIDLFRSVAYDNGPFYRLGYTLVAIAAFILLCARINKLPVWLHKTGSETLTIYAAHYVVLYGTWFGLGIKHFTSHALAPSEVIVGAILFVLAGIIMATKLDDIRATKLYYRFTNLPKRIASSLR